MSKTTLPLIKIRRTRGDVLVKYPTQNMAYKSLTFVPLARAYASSFKQGDQFVETTPVYKASQNMLVVVRNAQKVLSETTMPTMQFLKQYHAKLDDLIAVLVTGENDNQVVKPYLALLYLKHGEYPKVDRTPLNLSAQFENETTSDKTVKTRKWLIITKTNTVTTITRHYTPQITKELRGYFDAVPEPDVQAQLNTWLNGLGEK